MRPPARSVQATRGTVRTVTVWSPLAPASVIEARRPLVGSLRVQQTAAETRQRADELTVGQCGWKGSGIALHIPERSEFAPVCHPTAVGSRMQTSPS
jgi:hypothetical protein